MAITLTPAAAERVRGYLDRRTGAYGLRLGVKKTGCSGFAYVVDLTDTADDQVDVVFESNGIHVVVDREALPLLDGTEVDYVRQGLNQAFAFHNPNVKDECGCGESFNV